MFSLSSLVHFALLLTGCYLLLSVWLFFSQDAQVFPSPKGWSVTPEQWGMHYETVPLNSDSHRLINWWIPADPAQPVVLFFHGNGENIEGTESHVRLFKKLGLSVFLLDYRGYGLSDGQSSELGTKQDGEAAWRYLVEEQGISPQRIIFYGHSLGGAVAVSVAMDHPPGKLILEGAFTSIPDRGAQLYPYLPVRLLARIHYPTADRLPQLKVPILIIHSKNDEVIPVSHGKKLFDRAQEPKWFYQTGGRHYSGFSTAGDHSEQILRTFIFSPPSEYGNVRLSD
ncbi:MAG: alpha/beta fold hydrolase [Magnetococcales bacterium]|nr:alpha/beta fold hydrolase [Magnetococcales bacterium]